jgi:WhiB family redox-sensing transcriptional regulator
MSPTPRPGAATAISRADLAWQDSAACRGEDPELFFSQDPGTGAGLAAFAAAEQARIRKAGAICRACPVRAECGRFAAGTGQRFGIWAGIDRERVRPAAPEPPVTCSKGLHLMTAENTKHVAGTSRVRCRACLRDSDRRTRASRETRKTRTVRRQGEDVAA